MRATMLLVGVLLGCGPAPSRVDGGAGGGLSLGGGFGGSSSGGGFGGGAQGGGVAGGAVGGGNTCTATGPLTFTQLHGSFSPYSPGGTRFVGGLDPSSRRAFTFPLSVTPSLRALTTVRFEGPGTTLPDGGSRAFVEPLPITGTVPTGNLTASAFDEQSGVLTGLFLARDPLHYEVATLTVSDAGARFTTLTQVDPPDANGFLLQTMYGTSSRLGVLAGNDVRSLTLSGTSAQWGPPVAAQAYQEIAAYDRDRDRVLSIGSYEFVPPMSARWVSTVHERGSTAPMPTPIPMTGVGLPSTTPGQPPPYPFVAWDAEGERLLVTGTRAEMLGGMTVMVPSVVEADLRTRQWRELPNRISSIVAQAPFLIDRANRQVFLGDLSALSLAPGRELSASAVKLTGALPPGSVSTLGSAARLPDGRVLVGGSDRLMAFSPASSTWSHLKAAVPTAQLGGAIAWDPVGLRTLLLFGQGAGVPSNAVSALAADEASFTAVTTTGTAPAGRTNAGIVVSGTTLLAAGGLAGTQTLGDVFALDLTTLSWRKLADVTPRQGPTLLVSDGAVYIVGGRAGMAPFVPAIERVDLASGAKTTLTSSGTAPTGYVTFAPLGGGLVGIDIGTSFDFGSNQLFELRLDATTATWTNTDPHIMDQALSPLVGVPGGTCDEAFFVGPSSFRVSR